MSEDEGGGGSTAPSPIVFSHDCSGEAPPLAYAVVSFSPDPAVSGSSITVSTTANPVTPTGDQIVLTNETSSTNRLVITAFTADGPVPGSFEYLLECSSTEALPIGGVVTLPSSESMFDKLLRYTLSGDLGPPLTITIDEFILQINV